MTTEQPIVYVVDDDELSRDSICALIQSMQMQTMAFESGEAFLNSYQPDQPGCVISDLRMTGMSGVELQERLMERGYPIPTILITAYASTPVTVRAMQNGAVTLLEKPYNDQALWDAVREALARDRDSREKYNRRIDTLQKLETLTDDERFVLRGIMAGKPNKTIAHELDVSVRTIESRRHNVFSKTGTESVAQLVKLVVESEHDLDSAATDA